MCFLDAQRAQEPDAVDKVHHCPCVSGKVYVRKRKVVFTFAREMTRLTSPDGRQSVAIFPAAPIERVIFHLLIER